MNRPTAGNDLVAMVRSGDYDRFLAIQRAPAGKRTALYAVLALHVEVASVAEHISEPLIGHIRYAWWREALEEIEAGKTPRNHPVVLALAHLHRDHAKLFPFLYEMIEARAADVDSSLIEEEAAWLHYCEHTAGALHMALAMIVDEEIAQRDEAIIRNHAIAYAIIGLVRAIPFMAANGWVRFPKVRMEAHQLASLAPSENLSQLVRDLMAKAAEVKPPKNNNLKLSFLKALVALETLYESRLQRVGFDPYRLSQGKLPSVWQVMWA